jgi:short-subunit dehydrogenase
VERPAALITGASSGIGAELAALCAAGGYSVILVARSTGRLTELAARLQREHRVPARVLTFDLADPSAPPAIHEQTRGDGVEILINNAGFGLLGPYAETDWAVEARLVQVNMTAPALLTKLFLRDMLARRTGRILNVASTAGFVPGPFMAMYYASKAFLISFSHAVANEVQGTGVTVTVLCPGPTRTDFARVAGGLESPLFKGPVMEAAEVARQGWEAMMAGKPQVIAGLRNRALIAGVGMLPLAMVARTARRLNVGDR